MLQRRATAVQPSIFDQLFGVGALAHRGLPPFIGGLCGDHSPHRTTMTQTKCCSIFAFWVMVAAHGKASMQQNWLVKSGPDV